MTSFQSRLWKYFLKPFYYIKSKISPGSNIKLSRTFESPFPPLKVRRKNTVLIEQILGRNLITIIPRQLKSDRINYYLHGGGYYTGITILHWWFISKIATLGGIRIAVIDYPLAPEYGFNDTFPFVRDVNDIISNREGHSGIIFMGDSAGGGLALGLAQELRDLNKTGPDSIFLLSPWLDVTMSNPDIDIIQKDDVLLKKESLIRTGKLYVKDSDARDFRISPVYGNLQGLPTIHLFTGSHDIAVADSRKLCELARNAGVDFHYYEFEKMLHVWLFLPIPEAKKAIDKIISLLHETG